MSSQDFAIDTTKILGTPHTLAVRYYYVTKSDTVPNVKVKNREQILKQFVKGRLSADVRCTYWGCAHLLSAARSAPQFRLNLTYTEFFNTSDSSTVSLVELRSLAEALKDESGDLRRSVLEPNVRAYQGKRNQVNQEIQKPLKNVGVEKGKEKSAPEFWWLNNGITILADHCAIV